MNIAIIGAGITGSTIARLLADSGQKVEIFERSHSVGGCAYDFDLNGTIVNQYGPHIFHTDNQDVWDFVNKFSGFKFIRYKVQALTKKGWMPWPVNRETISLACGSVRSWKQEIESGGSFENADKYKLGIRLNYETEAIKLYGERIYKLMIRNYVMKHYGSKPSKISPENFEKILIDPYEPKNVFYNSQYVGLPINGYTKMIESMLNHENIIINYRMEIGRKYLRKLNDCFDVVISTASPDDLLNYRHTAIPYRKSSFIFLDCDTDWPTPSVNFSIKEIPFVSGVDYKRLYKGTKSITVMELPGSGDKLYPIRTKHNIGLVKRYNSDLNNQYGVYSLGRLGLYRKLSMANCIEKAMSFVTMFKLERRN